MQTVPLLFWFFLGAFSVYGFWRTITPDVKYTHLERGLIGIFGIISAILDIIFLWQMKLPEALMTRLWVVTIIAAICYIVVDRTTNKKAGDRLPRQVGVAFILAGTAIYPFYLETLLSTVNIMLSQ